MEIPLYRSPSPRGRTLSDETASSQSSRSESPPPSRNEIEIYPSSPLWKRLSLPEASSSSSAIDVSPTKTLSDRILKLKEVPDPLLEDDFDFSFLDDEFSSEKLPEIDYIAGCKSMIRAILGLDISLVSVELLKMLSSKIDDLLAVCTFEEADTRLNEFKSQVRSCHSEYFEVESQLVHLREKLESCAADYDIYREFCKNTSYFEEEVDSFVELVDQSYGKMEELEKELKKNEDRTTKLLVHGEKLRELQKNMRKQKKLMGDSLRSKCNRAMKWSAKRQSLNKRLASSRTSWKNLKNMNLDDIGIFLR